MYLERANTNLLDLTQHKTRCFWSKRVNMDQLAAGAGAQVAVMSRQSQTGRGQRMMQVRRQSAPDFGTLEDEPLYLYPKLNVKRPEPCHGLDFWYQMLLKSLTC